MDKLRKDIVRSIRGQFPNVSLKEIDKIIVAFLNQVKEEVAEGNTVNLYGFGKFSSADIVRESHYNALEDVYEDKTIEYKKISFKSSKVWKDEVNGRTKE